MIYDDKRKKNKEKRKEKECVVNMGLTEDTTSTCVKRKSKNWNFTDDPPPCVV
jgi:hypothetical protein